MSACFLQTNDVQNGESQLLNLAMRCADHCTDIATWLMRGSVCRPAHAFPPRTVWPSSGHCSTCAGRDSSWSFLKNRKITQRCCSQAWGLFRCPSEECSNDGMQNYTTLSDFSRIGTIGHVQHKDVWKTDAPHSSGYLNVCG